MSWAHLASHVLVPSLVAAAAALGAWRCWRLLRYGHDRRLAKLLWFYGLFAASLVPWAVWVGQLALGFGDAQGVHGATGVHGSAGPERVNILLVAHHALMLTSLGVAVQAFSHKRMPAVAIVLAFLGPFIPVALAMEAAMALYLAVGAVLNHVERRSPGALQAAAGFLLFSIGHLSFFLLHHPGAARSLLGDVLALVGVVLLVQLLPRPSA